MNYYIMYVIKRKLEQIDLAGVDLVSVSKAPSISSQSMFPITLVSSSLVSPHLPVSFLCSLILVEGYYSQRY